MKTKLKISLVCFRAGNFDGGHHENFKKSVATLKKFSRELDFDFHHFPRMVLTSADADEARAALEAQRPDFLMLQTTSFPSGENIIKLAKTCKRIGLWGLPETSCEGSNFVNSNNSFCGINMAGGIIKHYLGGLGIQHKWFFGHGDDERFRRRFTLTAKALSAIKKTASSKVALVGGIAPGFNDLYYDERLALTRLGVEINRGHEFSEIQKRAHSYKDSEVAEMSAAYVCGKCASDVKKQDIAVSARYYRAYREFALEYGYDALAVSCWPQIKEETLACSIIGKLNQDGIPAACEGDAPGAVAMMMLRHITGLPATLMDLCGIDESDETALMWHCGPSPEFYAGKCGVTTKRSCQLNDEGGKLTYPLIHDMVFKPQPVTFMRVTGEWDEMFLLDGKVIDRPKPSPDGSRGWIDGLNFNGKPVKTLDFFNTVLTRGFQHHYPMMAGNLAAVCMEMASWLGLKMMRVCEYEDYKQ
ncbi:MAG: hypothetical protein FWG05_01685 [Kiritimatiellaeota bacterium]|nr:hypothetical protein [Kiritimatiellota bacterium]